MEWAKQGTILTLSSPVSIFNFLVVFFFFVTSESAIALGTSETPTFRATASSGVRDDETSSFGASRLAARIRMAFSTILRLRSWLASSSSLLKTSDGVEPPLKWVSPWSSIAFDLSFSLRPIVCYCNFRVGGWKP